MKRYFFCMAVAGLLAGLSGCDDNFEAFERTGGNAAPAALPASSISSEALPGEIKLTWTTPEEGAFEYMYVEYHDPLTKEDVKLLLSNKATELLIEETRQRFGDYTFNFQTFNAAGVGSEVTTVTAQSGPAPITQTETWTEVALTGDQLSTDCQEPTEGPVANVVNGNLNDFFHARWSSPQVALPHYIQIDFNEPHQVFAIEWWNRIVGNSDGFPTRVELQIFNTDTGAWETVTTLTNLIASSGAHNTTTYFDAGREFTQFRFNVTEATVTANYFHLAELKFYDVLIEIYDPETVPLD